MLTFDQNPLSCGAIAPIGTKSWRFSFFSGPCFPICDVSGNLRLRACLEPSRGNRSAASTFRSLPISDVHPWPARSSGFHPFGVALGDHLDVYHSGALSLQYIPDDSFRIPSSAWELQQLCTRTGPRNIQRGDRWSKMLQVLGQKNYTLVHARHRSLPSGVPLFLNGAVSLEHIKHRPICIKAESSTSTG